MNDEKFLRGEGRSEMRKEVGNFTIEISHTEDGGKDFYECTIAPQDFHPEQKLDRKTMLEERTTYELLSSKLIELGARLTSDPVFIDRRFSFYFRPADADKKFDHINGLYASIAKAIDGFAPQLPQAIETKRTQIEKKCAATIAEVFGVRADVVQSILAAGKELERKAYRNIKQGRAA